jgi:hypothetical protein
MSSAPRPSPRTIGSQSVEGDGPVAHLRVVEPDAYANWESVYRDNVDRLYRLMYARVGNRPDAEDLTSEAFRTALGPLRLGSSKGEVRSYLLVTAQTVLASHWRRTLGRPVSSIDPEADLPYLSEPSSPDEPSDAPQRPRRFLPPFPTVIAASSSSGSSKRARSRRRRRPWASSWAMKRSCSTGLCGWRRRPEWSWNSEQPTTICLRRCPR